MQHTPQDTDPNWLVSQKPILLSELFCCRGNLYLNMQRLLNDTEPSAVDKESISDVLSPGRLKNMLGFFFLHSWTVQGCRRLKTDRRTAWRRKKQSLTVCRNLRSWRVKTVLFHFNAMLFLMFIARSDCDTSQTFRRRWNDPCSDNFLLSAAHINAFSDCRTCDTLVLK